MIPILHMAETQELQQETRTRCREQEMSCLGDHHSVTWCPGKPQEPVPLLRPAGSSSTQQARPHLPVAGAQGAGLPWVRTTV